MLRIQDSYFGPDKEKLKSRCTVLLTVFMLLGTFGPVITLTIFYTDFDKHVMECRQERHHDEDCRAQCVLADMMPGQTDPMSDRSLGSSYFFPPLFFQDRTVVHTASITDAMAANHFFRYTGRYFPPGLEIGTPPPQF
ncbi:hypothetical protein [Pricia sp.]|uniref:hypothetical protein n=1 Tax=Pricia sp. TaxID=2268138 RepID=UPI003593F530